MQNGLLKWASELSLEPLLLAARGQSMTLILILLLCQNHCNLLIQNLEELKIDKSSRQTNEKLIKETKSTFLYRFPLYVYSF